VLVAALCFGVTVVGATVLQRYVAGGAAVLPTLLVYEAVLVVIAGVLAVPAREPAAGALTDLVVDVVELDPDPDPHTDGTLAHALRHVLADPSIAVGYWDDATERYLDAVGEPVDTTRTWTPVERHGRLFAAVVHGPATLADPAVRRAVATATRLMGSHAALQAEVRAQIAEVVRSRRRLVVAADEELGRLGRRLETGPGRRLAELLASLGDRPGCATAVEQLRLATAELRELAAGLHPRDLANGIEAALVALARRCPMRCHVAVDPAAAEAAPPHIAAALYFVGAEALANVVKHAGAATVTVELTLRDGNVRLAISDDGVGGADPAGGKGCPGLADRVAALGGSLTVHERQPSGTTVVAQIPTAHISDGRRGYRPKPPLVP